MRVDSPPRPAAGNRHSCEHVQEAEHRGLKAVAENREAVLGPSCVGDRTLAQLTRHLTYGRVVRIDVEGPGQSLLRLGDFTDLGEGEGELGPNGGGNGSLLTAILKSNPNLTGILFDLGHVVGRARDLIGEQGVGDRCSVVEGNVFESIPDGAAAYLFRHIINDWNDEQCVQILGNCRQVIANDGRLLVAEFVVPDGNEPSLAKDSDITVMVFPGGIERTEAEYAELFEQAGFRLSSVTPTESAISIVEARPS